MVNKILPLQVNCSINIPSNELFIIPKGTASPDDSSSPRWMSVIMSLHPFSAVDPFKIVHPHDSLGQQIPRLPVRFVQTWQSGRPRNSRAIRFAAIDAASPPSAIGRPSFFLGPISSVLLSNIYLNVSLYQHKRLGTRWDRTLHGGFPDYGGIYFVASLLCNLEILFSP